MDESNEHLVYENDYTANKFLDSMIFVTFDQIYFGIYNCNELFCLTGNMENHVKHRFAPAIGTERIILDRLVCNILSRRARWQQLMLSTREVIKQTILDCSECILLGYKPKTILRAYRKSAAHDRFFAVSFRTALQMVKGAKYINFQWRIPKTTMQVLESLYGVDMTLYPFGSCEF